MSNPTAGWYLTPDDANTERWWDGTAWTDHTRRKAAPVQSPPPPATSPPSYSQSTSFSMISLLSAGISLLWNPFLVLSVVAIIFGGVALSKASTNGESKRPAMAGLIFGLVGLVLGLILISTATRGVGF